MKCDIPKEEKSTIDILVQINLKLILDITVWVHVKQLKSETHLKSWGFEGDWSQSMYKQKKWWRIHVTIR